MLEEPSSYEKASNLLSKLISIPSPSGREEELSYFIYEYLGGLGFNPILDEVYKTGQNVVVKLGRGDKLLICGHLDTIPPLDMKEPYKPIVRNDRVYGRGACDMKGGLTSMLLVLEELSRAKYEPDVTFAFVVDEEMYGRGAADLLIRGVDAKDCIILEPTSMDICVGNAGCVEFNLIFHGRSGHGACREAENTVISFLNFYKELEDKINLEFSISSDYPMSPILNLGRIEAGYSGWVIPWEVKADILIHFHPKITYSKILDFLRKEIKEYSTRRNTEIRLEVIHGCDGFITNSKYVNLLTEVHRRVLRIEPKHRVIESETDANALYYKAGIESIIYGPGEIKYAHSSEENIKVKDIVDVAKVLKELLLELNMN
jgi:acetylornithine deacetylase/succinyl-diaminopimelate desuccinylase family protein